MHFLQHLRSLKALSSDAPDEAPMESDESRVRIMTIHASKGLEAPIVFLADTISRTKDRNSHATLVDWPVSKSCPSHFMLIPGSAQRDSLSKKMVDQQKQMQEKEDANLLYVAMTRAKQCLFISACLPDKKPYLDWYHDILTGIEGIAQEINENHWQYQNIELPYNADKIKKPAQVNQKSDSHLLKKNCRRVCNRLSLLINSLHPVRR